MFLLPGLKPQALKPRRVRAQWCPPRFPPRWSSSQDISTTAAPQLSVNLGYLLLPRKYVASCTLIVSSLSWHYCFCFSVCCSMRDKACKEPWRPSKGTYFALFLLSFAWQPFIKVCTACPLQLSQKNLHNNEKNCSTTTNLSFRELFCRSNSLCRAWFLCIILIFRDLIAS